jgi:glycosyltransferase involved in cell wall biosynthesis
VARRILLLITDLEIGGTPTVVRELATRLNDPPEVEVDVACLAGWGPVAEQLRNAGVTVILFEASRAWQFPSVLRHLVQLIRERGYDTVFSFLIHANAIAAAASRHTAGVRFLQSIQTVQPKPRWHWWLQRLIHGRAEAIVCPSTAVAERAKSVCDVPAEKIIVIPNAIDPDAFPRVDVFADPNRVRVGFLGRLDPVKNLRDWTMLLIWAERDGVHVEGHIFGEGPDRTSAEKVIEYFDAADRIFLRGATSSPQDALAQMDVLLFTGRQEGFGLVVIEAMASGVPVVAIRAGGVTDVVSDGINALLFDTPFSDQSFGHVLDRLRTDVSLRQRIIENGLSTVREKFTWDVVLPQYRQLLRLNQISPAPPP